MIGLPSPTRDSEFAESVNAASSLQRRPQAMHLDLGIDADAPVTTGHKMRRCRILRRAASGVAAVLTVGLVSYGVIANRTIAGEPAPAHSASVLAATAALTPPSASSPPSAPRGRQVSVSFR